MPRPTVDPLSVTCPKCDAKPGGRCTNYQGKNCAPHSGRGVTSAPPEPPALAVLPPPPAVPDPAAFTEDTPPPRGRPKGTPLPAHVELRTLEPVAEQFAEWDATGRIPAGCRLAEFVGVLGCWDTHGPEARAWDGSGYRTPDGEVIPPAELEGFNVRHWVRHEKRPGRVWVVLAPVEA